MNILKVEFRKISRGLLIWAGVLCGFILLYLAFYESMSELFWEKMDMMPDAMLGMFRLDSFSDMAGYSYYYATIITFMVLGASCYGSITGANLFIREEAEGTIEFLNSQPVTRGRIISAKLAATALGMLLLVLAMAAASWLGSILFSAGQEFAQALIGITLLCYLPVFVFWAVGCLVSVLLHKAGAALPLSLGLLFFSYILGAISGMVQPLGFLKWLSPMDYVPATKVITSTIGGGSASTDITGPLLCIVLVAVCIAGTYYVYRRKDLAV